MKQHIITISRQFGSGGSEIAKKLASDLKLPYYDKNIIEHASNQSGIAREHFEKADEKRTNSFLFSLVSAHYGGSATPLQLNDIITDDKLFIYTADAIKEVAKSPCVIVGRCADDILRDYKILRVFVFGDTDYRIKRISELYELNDKAAATLIKKTDKRRANYYNFYTGRDWGRADNYDLCINSFKIGIDGATDVIKNVLQNLDGLPQ